MKDRLEQMILEIVRELPAPVQILCKNYYIQYEQGLNDENISAVLKQLKNKIDYILTGDVLND